MNEKVSAEVLRSMNFGEARTFQIEEAKDVNSIRVIASRAQDYDNCVYTVSFNRDALTVTINKSER